MNDYLLFLLLNGVTFVISMVLWNWLPKGKPYDYTTVPGPSLDDSEGEQRCARLQQGSRGHSGFINQARSLVDYVNSLHIQHGPIVSFYLKHVYVVSVNTPQYITQLIHCDNNKYRNDVLHETKQIIGQLQEESTHQVVNIYNRFIIGLGNITCIDQGINELAMVTYDREIDLNGYPIPQNVPVFFTTHTLNIIG